VGLPWLKGEVKVLCCGCLLGVVCKHTSISASRRVLHDDTMHSAAGSLGMPVWLPWAGGAGYSGCPGWTEMQKCSAAAGCLQACALVNIQVGSTHCNVSKLRLEHCHECISCSIPAKSIGQVPFHECVTLREGKTPADAKQSCGGHTQAIYLGRWSS